MQQLSKQKKEVHEFKGWNEKFSLTMALESVQAFEDQV